MIKTHAFIEGDIANLCRTCGQPKEFHKQDEAVEFARRMIEELSAAMQKFPPEKSPTFHALIEECGELAKALMEESRPQVYYEAVQVATMAMRLAIEGDFTINRFRVLRGLETWGPLSDFLEQNRHRL